MSQPPLPVVAPAVGTVKVNIVGCLSLPNNMQVWVVTDQASAQGLARMLGGQNLILTLDNVRQMWEQATGQKRIVVPSIRPRPAGEN